MKQNKNPHNLEVGQELYRVTDTSITRRTTEKTEHVKITKIGHKWATVGEGWNEEKVCLKTLAVDGGDYSSPAQCYLSQEQYEDEVKKSSAWRRIHNLTMFEKNHKHLSLDDVLEIEEKIRGN